MKKAIIFSILVGIFIFTPIGIEAAQADNSQAAKQVKTASENSIYETSLIKIVKKGNKYGVWDKKQQQYIVKPVLDSITKFAKNNDFEYKITSENMLGYMNLVSRDTFLSYFDDISIIDSKYLRVKKGDKFGVTDKTGKVIVPVEYQRVSVTQYDKTEYLIGKSDKKYTVYYNDGSLVSGSDFSSLDKTTYGASIVRNLNPALKEYRASVKEAQAGVETAYITETVVLDTEIEELPIPTMSRNEETGDVEPKVYKKSSIVSTNYSTDAESVIEIAKYPIPTRVRKVAVKSPDYSPVQKDKSVEKPKPKGNAVEVITLNNKSYYITNNNGKIGLQTRKGKELIPTQYAILTIKKIDNHEIVAAIDDKKTAKLYDTNGNIIAKRYIDRINVYTPMRKYEYYQDGNLYSVAFNNKKVGEIEVFNDGSYEYKRYGFNTSGMHKANEIFAALLSAEK